MYYGVITIRNTAWTTHCDVGPFNDEAEFNRWEWHAKKHFVLKQWPKETVLKITRYNLLEPEEAPEFAREYLRVAKEKRIQEERCPQRTIREWFDPVWREPRFGRALRVLVSGPGSAAHRRSKSRGWKSVRFAEDLALFPIAIIRKIWGDLLYAVCLRQPIYVTPCLYPATVHLQFMLLPQCSFGPFHSMNKFRKWRRGVLRACSGELRGYDLLLPRQELAPPQGLPAFIETAHLDTCYHAREREDLTKALFGVFPELGEPPSK